jgi:heptosyltransferase-1
MRNILIVKPSALGDVIQATCILPLLKTYAPGSRISWLVFEHNAEVVRNHPLIDHVISINRSGRFLPQFPVLLRKLRQARFDTVIDLQCLLRSAFLSRLTGCSRRIGYANGREFSTLFYTETYDIPRDTMHAVDGYLHLCKLLGMARHGEVTFPIPLQDAHRNRLDALISGFMGKGPAISICPTAKWETKCWPEQSFATLADLLSGRLNARVILLGAPSETEIVGRIGKRMRHEHLDLSGKLSILEVAALLERSALFIGNDSGLMHLASATKTRTVAIFGPTDPKRTGPYNGQARVAALNLSCSPCFKRNCEGLRCLKDLSPEVVAETCIDHLQQSPAPLDELMASQKTCLDTSEASRPCPGAIA